MLDESIARQIDAGSAVQLLKIRSKLPFYDEWSSRPVATFEELKKAYKPGMNIGLRTGKWSKSPSGQYTHVIDFDIRDPSAIDDAWDALDRICPEHDKWPCVRSGSGLGRHFHIGTERPYRYLIIEKSPDTFKDPKTGKIADRWKIEFYGTGKQVVLPPSIHPDTGKAYEWIREPNWALARVGEDVLPMISAKQITEWGDIQEDRKSTEPDSLEEVVRLAPLDWSIEKIKDLVANLPDEWAERYDLWLKVGSALHHEFDGGNDGLDIWHWFSKVSKKYVATVLDDKWDSFGKNRRPITLKSLIIPARENRFDKEYRSKDDREDVDDDDTDSWMDQLHKTEKGIKPTLPNFELILNNDLRTAGKLCYNEFTDEIVYRDMIDLGLPGASVLKPKDRINGSPLRDIGYVQIRKFFETKRSRKHPLKSGWGLTITDRDLKAAVEAAAHNNRFNPVIEYIEAETWDGVERVEEIFIHFMGTPDTLYHRAVARYMMLGAVVRAYEPGHKFDFVPIIEGIQGARKSSFVEALAGHWFAELHADFSDTKRLVETMLGSWILEIPELSQFNRDQVREIKAFLSGKMDKVRLSYRRDAERFYRYNIFIGTTNDSVYLSDNTGHRRFWSLRAEKQIDIEEFKEIVPQLWAETLVLYRAMRKKQPRDDLKLFLDDREEAAEQKAMAEERELESTEKQLAGELKEWLDGRDNGRFDQKPRELTCVLDIWRNFYENPKNKMPTKTDSNNIGRALNMIPEFEKIGPARTPTFGVQKCWRIKNPVRKQIAKNHTKNNSDLI